MDSLDPLGHAILSGETGEIITSSGDLYGQEDTIAYLWKIWQDIILSLEISNEMETSRQLASQELKLRKNDNVDKTQQIVKCIKENRYDFKNLGIQVDNLKSEQEKLLLVQNNIMEKESLFRVSIQLKQYQYVLGANKTSNEVFIVKKYSDDP